MCRDNGGARRAMTWVGGVLLAVVQPSPVAAYDGVTAVGETGRQLVAFVREAHDKAGFSGAVLAGKEGKVIAAVAVGTVGDGSGAPLAVDSLFEIASCTKSFTAIAVMKLVEEDKLALDDPIADHLPGIPHDCQAITVRHLLQHTSGIPRDNSEGYGKELAKVLPTFLKGGPQTSPGEKHAYWNQGYALLSEIIARSSRKSYTRYMREAIFEPCKMKHSCFTGNRPPRGIAVATGKSSRGAARTALEHPYGEYGFQYRGMGGMVTNLIDLWRWDRTMAKGDLLSTASIQEMTTPGDAGYALGWRIKRLASGDTVHQHTGSVRGFLASIRRHPSEDGCLFVLANSDESEPFNLVRAGCEAIVEGRAPQPLGRVAEDPRLSPLQLADLAGVYVDEAGRTFTILVERGKAKVLIDWNGPITYGWLGAAADEGFLFATGKRYSKKAFLAGDPVRFEQQDGKATALEYTIAEINKTLRFVRDGPP